MDLDTTDAGMSPMIMGITNVVTAYLPSKWSRFFPVIPIALGIGYAIYRSKAEAAATGAGSIALYSIVRNVFGTKPKDALKK